jgi:hypothetical protein
VPFWGWLYKAHSKSTNSHVEDRYQADRDTGFTDFFAGFLLSGVVQQRHAEKQLRLKSAILSAKKWG